MFQLKLKMEDEASSYSEYSHALGASLFAALVSNNVVPQHELDPYQYAGSYHWDYKIAGAPQSYQHLRVIQATPAQQLTMALRSLYDSLAAEQQDLEPETKDVLYANLWSLYS